MDLRLITVAAQLGQGIQAPCSGRNPLNLTVVRVEGWRRILCDRAHLVTSLLWTRTVADRVYGSRRFVRSSMKFL